jgi:Carboxypeptidase regulatory-like domain
LLVPSVDEEEVMCAELRRAAVISVVIGLLLAGSTPVIAQVATGTVAGSVKDPQGGVMPGSTVTLISATRGTSVDVQTNSAGEFVFPNVAGDRYHIRVTMSGFKTLERRDIPVSPGDRVVVGTLTIEVGALSETVTVSSEAPIIQAQTGERSFTIGTESVQNLPINSRNWSALTAVIPGVVGSVRLGSPGANNNNVMMDGVAIMDTGNNGQMLQTNVDAIAEVKILTQGYQAEYGRASGMQITAVTKSGSNQFHGSVYDLERNSDWNANSWANQKNGDPKTVSKQRDWGFTIGGPAGKPGGTNKLFFFYAHEIRPRTTGGAISRFRVPTLLERQGDFSETTDNNGALFRTIRDASTGLPCTATNTTGCFQSGGVVGRIPTNRLYNTGLNILKLWPAPNASGLNYNFENVAPEDKRTTQQPTVRFDYQASTKLRISAKYTGQLATVKPTVGSIPGFNDTMNKFPFIYQPSTTVNYTVTPTLFMEGTYGYIQNQLGTPIISPASNRCNVGLCDIPLLFPDAGLVDPRYYNPTVLEAINSPMFVDGRIMLPPTFAWGSRIANAPPSLIYPAFLNKNRTHNVSLSATKLAGRHTMKAGFYWFNARKYENLGITGAIPFNGLLSFSQDTNNPLDSGFGFSNAALGIFSEYSQQSKFVEGAYGYNNTEWFVQDNWRLNSRLTLDYGLRFTHQQPQHDTLLQPHRLHGAQSPVQRGRDHCRHARHPA